MVWLLLTTDPGCNYTAHASVTQIIMIALWECTLLSYVGPNISYFKKTTYLMLDLITLIDFCKYMHISKGQQRTVK